MDKKRLHDLKKLNDAYKGIFKEVSAKINKNSDNDNGNKKTASTFKFLR